jgi:outer membrane protein assembly factor BamB
MYEEPLLDTVPQPLRSIAECCLAKDPQARPDLAELHRAFEALPDSHDAMPPPAPVSVPSGKDAGRPVSGRRAKRQLTLMGLGAAVTATALSAALLVYASDTDSAGSPDRSASGSSGTGTAARSVSLPDGWQPWSTHLRYDNGLPSGYIVTGYDEAGCVTEQSDLYCGGTGFVVAKVDAATGRAGWRYGTRPQNSRPISVRDGLVHVYEEQNETDRRLVALDTGTGKRRWARAVSPNRPSVPFSGGLLTLSADNSEFVAYSTAGKELWRSPVPSAFACVPSVLGDALYGLCWQGEELEHSQVTLWRLDASDGAGREIVTVPEKALALGAVDGQPLFLAPQTAEDVYESGYERPYNAFLRVDPDSGNVTRIPLKRALRGSATLVDGVVHFVRTNGMVTAVSATTGKELWQKSTGTENLSAPVVSKAHQQVYFANRFGRLVALDSGTGAELWSTDAIDDPGDIAAEAVPSVLLVKDAVVAMAGDTAFSVSPEGPTARATGAGAGD